MAKSECESFGRKVVNKLGFSKISRDTTDQMVVVARKQIISDQGASDGSYGRSRNNCLLVDFLL